MTRRARKRLWILLGCGLCLGSAAGFVLWALSDKETYFKAPSDFIAHAPPLGRLVRLGGLVEMGTIERSTVSGTPTARFKVTDGAASIEVSYAGILPDLFREGTSVVAMGTLQPDGTFRAQEVLAKHDETYMPKDVADALKKSGRWNPGAGPPPPAATWNTLTTTREGG